MPRPNKLQSGRADVRLAVVSPFVDRRHGTERALAELLERLARDHHCEVHLYAQRVADLTLSPPQRLPGNGSIVWHRVPAISGPQLVQFLSWCFLNSISRAWDRFVRGSRFDAVLSPGINCLDADVILVHVVFHRLDELRKESAPGGLRGIHRRLYYRMMCAFERWVYVNPRVRLAGVSRHTASQLLRYFARDDAAVTPHGVDSNTFCPMACTRRRAGARHRWRFSESEIVLLLIGNDWRNKGLTALLEAAALCGDLPLRLLVVGDEDVAPFAGLESRLGLSHRVTFAPPCRDVLDFFAAADVYVAPSLEDSFNLPVLEAMACGLPVIVSACAGISDWIHDGLDGILLRDPKDAAELAANLRNLLRNPDAMRRLGEAAVRTAANFTWDRHAAGVHALLVNHCTQRR